MPMPMPMPMSMTPLRHVEAAVATALLKAAVATALLQAAVATALLYASDLRKNRENRREGERDETGRT